MTKEYEIWKWLANNGGSTTPEIRRAMKLSPNAMRQQLKRLRAGGHVSASSPAKNNIGARYVVVASNPPPKNGRWAAANVKRAIVNDESTPLQWEGLTRRELNPLITMPLIRIETEALRGAV